MKVLVSVLCGTERHAWLNPELVGWILSQNTPEGMELEIALEKDLWPVSHARNVAANRALVVGADWSVQIDNDEVPPLEFLSYLQVADKRGLDVLGIVTCTYVGDGRLPVPNVPAHDTPRMASDDLFEEVPRVGAGCFSIHRRVLEKIPPPWFALEYDKQSGMTEAEDFVFCRRARETGFRVWIAKGIAAEHFKTTGMLNFYRNMRELAPQERVKLQSQVRDIRAPWT